jgi:hypothetical protein
VAFIADAKEDFISIAQEQYMKAAESVGRKAKIEDAFAIGGHLDVHFVNPTPVLFSVGKG